MILLFLLCIVFSSIVLLYSISIKFVKFFKILSFFLYFLIFLLVFHIVYNINLICVNFQHFFFSNWISILNISFVLGIDGISGSFILLTAFLIPLCILYSWNQFFYTFKELALLLFIIEFLLLSFFLVLDLIFFFFF
jgi:NADH-quinone oxidoreductase subunit M